MISNIFNDLLWQIMTYNDPQTENDLTMFNDGDGPNLFVVTPSPIELGGGVDILHQAHPPTVGEWGDLQPCCEHKIS